MCQSLTVYKQTQPEICQGRPATARGRVFPGRSSGAWWLTSLGCFACSIRRRVIGPGRPRAGGEKRRVAAAPQRGQSIGWPDSAIARQASNGPQVAQSNS